MKGRGMIEAVLFDLDGTIKINVPSGMEIFVEYARELGCQIDQTSAAAGARWNHWYWAQSQELMQDLALEDETDFWIRYSRRLLVALGESEADNACAQALTEQFARYAPRAQLNDGAHETLVALGQAGYGLGLVSNRRHPLGEAVTDLGLDGIFAFTLAAGEIGIWKPDPAIFDAVLETQGLQAGRCAYVGDNYYADVVSAREAGLTPVLLDPKGVFPDADCKVIGRLPELLDWLALDQSSRSKSEGIKP